MGNCSSHCRQKAGKNQAVNDEKQIYICPLCSAFKGIPFGEPAPECCGKKMLVLQ